MRLRIAVGLLVMVTGAAQTTLAASDERLITRVKGLGDEFTSLIREGDRRSQTFSAMVDEIQASNAVVMIQFGLCAKGQFRSCVSHVGATGGTRTIRILINPKLTMDRVIAMIAHELQHAVEIIRSGAANQDEVMTLYRRIAIGECAKGRSDRCETEAALAVERRVLDELDRSSGAQP
jgi:hypothetical protein